MWLIGICGKTSSDEEQMASNWGKCPTYTMTKESKWKIIALAFNCIQKKRLVFLERAI